MIEVGQIYSLKKDSKVERIKEREMIRIEKYENEFEEKKIKGVWSICVKDENGDWVAPEKLNPYIFRQQIETHYILEFEPMRAKKSRLENVED